LTTSTSDEVCELYNGTGIVRMIGSPQILELLWFPTEAQTPNHGLFTVIEAYHDGRMKPKPSTRWGVLFLGQNLEEKSEASSLTSTYKADEENKLSPNLSPPKPSSNDPASVKGISAPNISLNLATRNRGELRCFAIFSVILQAGLLIFP